uniref:Uncharacterized protein n=1 Tax=Arundo donax TaxID=35708 RepID=A0A0A9H3T8_ARUDO
MFCSSLVNTLHSTKMSLTENDLYLKKKKLFDETCSCCKPTTAPTCILIVKYVVQNFDNLAPKKDMHGNI